MSSLWGTSLWLTKTQKKEDEKQGKGIKKKHNYFLSSVFSSTHNPHEFDAVARTTMTMTTKSTMETREGKSTQQYIRGNWEMKKLWWGLNEIFAFVSLNFVEEEDETGLLNSRQHIACYLQLLVLKLFSHFFSHQSSDKVSFVSFIFSSTIHFVIPRLVSNTKFSWSKFPSSLMNGNPTYYSIITIPNRYSSAEHTQSRKMFSFFPFAA